MGGLIPESFIEELLGRIDIVELVERHVPLKRHGREFQACCPFHDEKTPSFTVSPQKQFYHCFGCGAHGSAIGFLMNYEGLEFIDAVEELARHAGLSVPREASAKPRPEESLYSTLEAASRYYQEQLRAYPEATAYLEKRGLSGEIAQEFGIGYAPAGWDGLVNHLGGSKEKMALLRRAGLLSEGKSGAYDKFRQRIMFPIHDRRGRVIAFGGRTIGEDGPKYLNSPETELFHKGRELYGLYRARKNQGRLQRMIVVEGYMDAVALAQYGFHNCVATLGTATTGDHAETALRAADEVVYCFDGDNAGRTAAWRALESTLPRLREGRQARFLFLPDGEDPDTMVRTRGAQAFAGLVDAALPLSEFFFNHFTAQVDMESIDGRARLVELAQPLLQTLPEGIFREMMQAELQALARYRPDDAKPRAPASRVHPRPRDAAQLQQRTPLRLALAHLVQNPSLARLVSEQQKLDSCELQGMEIYREVVDFCVKHPNMSSAQLLELWREHPAQPHLKTLATWPLEGEDVHRAQEFKDALTSLELQWTEVQIARMQRTVDQNTDQKSLQLELLSRRQDLIRTLAGE
ncbi:MAG TPA: DNA primase [Xanthomonadales bacterium]|nr:DNA primase [Xanthomonadales bacterium]